MRICLFIYFFLSTRDIYINNGDKEEEEEFRRFLAI